MAAQLEDRDRQRHDWGMREGQRPRKARLLNGSGPEYARCRRTKGAVVVT